MKKKESKNLNRYEMNSKAKGFLFYRESNNLGDYIQSIAAKKLIDERAVPIDREALNSYNGPITKLIMNGWFMENSKNWPPSDNIKPLMISFHINPIAVKNMLKPIGVEFFKKHEPIGCRDLYTQNVLTQYGVESYFSGCLTLTLKNKNKNKTGEGILVLGAIDRIKPKINLKSFILDILKFPKKYKKYKTSRIRLNSFIKRLGDSKIIYSSQIVKSKAYSEQEKFSLAEKQLDLISKSRIIITSRIHTALPAISLGVKVIFLTDGLDHINQKSRLEGLSDYFYCCNTNDLKNIDINKIRPKKNHTTISHSLKEKVKKFLDSDK